MRIGVDLGGTKIEALALDSLGRTLARRRVASPRNDYEATLEAVCGLVQDLERELGERGTVGVGIPGAVSGLSGLVKNANSTWIVGQPLDRDLEARLNRPVRLANDANCFALSEAVDGAAAGAGVVFGVILGTGVGGGLVVEGRCLSGRHGVSGEWGHNPLPWADRTERDGPLCYCGRRGCVEVFLSGPGLARDHLLASGQSLAAEEVAARALAGDPAAAASMARYEDRLARALASVINVIDPDVIVLGGGLSKIEALYHAVPGRLAAHVFGGEADTPVLPPRHGDSSGVRGAAWLWEDDSPAAGASP